MMQVRLLEIARIELDESVDYYNSESAGLGDEFLVEVLLVLDRIKIKLGTRPVFLWWPPYALWF
jgi:hypothetical protein